MKVYRIKHKPSGLYWDVHKRKLTENGTVYDLLPYVYIGLVWVQEHYYKQYHPNEFEIKEYDLED